MKNNQNQNKKDLHDDLNFYKKLLKSSCVSHERFIKKKIDIIKEKLNENNN